MDWNENEHSWGKVIREYMRVGRGIGDWDGMERRGYIELFSRVLVPLYSNSCVVSSSLSLCRVTTSAAQ